MDRCKAWLRLAFRKRQRRLPRGNPFNVRNTIRDERSIVRKHHCATRRTTGIVTVRLQCGARDPAELLYSCEQQRPDTGQAPGLVAPLGPLDGPRVGRAEQAEEAVVTRWRREPLGLLRRGWGGGAPSPDGPSKRRRLMPERRASRKSPKTLEAAQMGLRRNIICRKINTSKSCRAADHKTRRQSVAVVQGPRMGALGLAPAHREPRDRDGWGWESVGGDGSPAPLGGRLLLRVCVPS